MDGVYVMIVAGEVRIIAALNTQIVDLAEVMSEYFRRHPAAEIYLSQPGLGVVLASRVMGEQRPFRRRAARKNYSGQSPMTRASGRKKVVLARYATNRGLGAALHMQTYTALTTSPGARAYCDGIRSRGSSHHAALRQLANRLVGILHG